MLALNSRSRVNHRKEVFKNKNPKGIESMKKAILVLIGLTMLVQCGSLWNDVPILGDVLGNQDELEKKDLQKRNLTLAALVLFYKRNRGITLFGATCMIPLQTTRG